MSTAPMTKLSLFFAAENDRTVILRQGPSKQVRMILWHRHTDTFEDGQWLKTKVYPERCDLSPDGRHFLYFTLNGAWTSATRGSFTALSRPPYWTALSLFPVGDTYAGGGVFLDNTHYLADGEADLIGRGDGLARVYQGDPSRDCRTGLRLHNGMRAPLDRAATRRLMAEPLPRTSWDWRARMQVPRGDARDRYDTMGGRLYRRHGLDLELIRDFSDMTFEPIRAPYDGRGEVDETPRDQPPWHPLDREGT